MGPIYLWLLGCLSALATNVMSKERSVDEKIFHRHSYPPPPQEPFPERPFISESFPTDMSHDAQFPNSEHIRAALELHPPILRYSNTFVCIPKISTIDITNNDDDDDIMLFSIASNDTQFHPVLFRPQAVPPKHTLSIQILFLPYFTHAVEALLYINTSFGDITYRIVGDSAENPYRLHPLIGYRIPSGVPFEQPFTIHNPHRDVLRIREIFTTEEFLSLHEISDDAEAGKALPPAAGTIWELDPGSERAVIRISMGSNMPGNYNGYVHLRTDKDTIVVPVELSVLDGGLHSIPAFVDFGHLTAVDETVSISLEVLNSGSQIVAITDIVVTTPESHLVVSKSSTQLLHPTTPTTVSTLTFRAPPVPGTYSGKLLVLTNHSNPALATLEVPYTAYVLYGGIGFEFHDGLFRIPVLNHTTSVSECSTTPITRAMTLTNYFDVPLQVISADISSCGRVVSIAGIPEDRVMPSHTAWSPLLLQFNHSLACTSFQLQRQLPFSCWIEFLTNVSTLQVPLYVLDGSVVLEMPFEKRVEVMPSGLRGSSYPTVDALLNAASATSLPTLLSSDVLVLNLGQVSAVSPRPVKLFLSNPNPVRTHISFVSRHWPMLVCYETPRQIMIRKQHGLTKNSLSGPFVRCDEINATHPTSIGIDVKAEHQLAVLMHPRALTSVGQQARMIEVISTYQRKIILLEMASVSGSAMSAYNPKSAFINAGIPSSIAIHTKSTFSVATEVQNIMLTTNTYGASVVTTLLPPNATVQTAEIYPLVQPCISKEEHIYACWLDMLTPASSLSEDTRKIFSQTLVTISALMTLSRNFSLAHDKISFLRSAWIREQKFGIPVAPFDVALTSHFTTSSVRVEPHIMMPLSTTPQHVLIEYPTIPTDHAVVLSVTIKNPFHVNIEFMPAFDGINIQYLEREVFMVALGSYSLEIENLSVVAEAVYVANSSLKSWCNIDADVMCNYVGTDNQYAVVRNSSLSVYKQSTSPSLDPGFYFTTQQTHVILQPRGEANIAHVLYVPQVNMPKTIETLQLYIANNFTGVDRIDVTASAAKVELSTVSVLAHFRKHGGSVTTAARLPTGAYLIPVIDRLYTYNVTLRNSGVMAVSVDSVRIHAAKTMPVCGLVSNLSCDDVLILQPSDHVSIPVVDSSNNCLMLTKEMPVELLSKGHVVFVLRTVHTLTEDAVYACMYEREHRTSSVVLFYAMIVVCLCGVGLCALKMTKIWCKWAQHSPLNTKLQLLRYNRTSNFDKRSELVSQFMDNNTRAGKEFMHRNSGGINLSDVIVSDVGLEKLVLKNVEDLRSKRISSYYSKPLSPSIIPPSSLGASVQCEESSLKGPAAARKFFTHDSSIVIHESFRGKKRQVATASQSTKLHSFNGTNKTKVKAVDDDAIRPTKSQNAKVLKSSSNVTFTKSTVHAGDHAPSLKLRCDDSVSATSKEMLASSTSTTYPQIEEYERVDDAIGTPQHTRTRSISLNAGIEESVNNIIDSSNHSDVMHVMLSEPESSILATDAMRVGTKIAHSRSADSHEARGCRGVLFTGPGDTISLESLSSDSNDCSKNINSLGGEPLSLFSGDIMEDLIWASQQRAPPGFSQHRVESSTFSDSSLFSTSSFYPKTPREIPTAPPPGYDSSHLGSHFDPFSETFDGFGLGEAPATCSSNHVVGSIGEKPQQKPHFRHFSSLDSPAPNASLSNADFFGRSAFFNINWNDDDPSMFAPLETDDEPSKSVVTG